MMKTVWTILVLQSACLHMVSGGNHNVARGKTARQSTTQNVNTGPEKGVDGNYNSIIQTASGHQSAWWTVDLEEQVQDAVITIFFRLGATTKRRSGIQLFVSSTPFSSYFNQEDSCATFGKSIPETINVTCSGTWRYFMIYTNITQHGDHGPILDFGEVKVWSKI